MTTAYQTESLAQQQLKAVYDQTVQVLHELVPIFGEEVIVSRTTALKLLRIELPLSFNNQNDRLHILSDRQHSQRLPDSTLITCHSTRIHYEPLDIEDHIRSVPPVLAWWQMSAYLNWEELVVLGDSMMRKNSSLKRITAEVFRKSINSFQPNTPRLAKCKSALRFMRPNTDSSMESRLRIQLERIGLGGMEINAQVFDAEEQHKWSIDLAWSEYQVGLEYDGHYHFSEQQVIADTHKRQRLRKSGWQIITVYAKDLSELSEVGPCSEIAKTIIAALERSSGKRVMAHETFSDRQLLKYGDILLLKRKYQKNNGNSTIIKRSCPPTRKDQSQSERHGNISILSNLKTLP
ncbi:hypothetical protein [Bifidobacterium sp. ESL0745]|uniref:hypothetical protein n=1 Tax=Bifidobacterium sp. ESL0745 TaxID=2983226 RepID=UPI0023F9D357|nr:hypothetical protein [Bifidobacterium sp. ESL0745]MDF7664551.1 hypothetical protein [Bifidobacterium sp. ESL0745]